MEEDGLTIPTEHGKVKTLGYEMGNYQDLIKNINNHIDESKFIEKSDSEQG